MKLNSAVIDLQLVLAQNKDLEKGRGGGIKYTIQNKKILVCSSVGSGVPMIYSFASLSQSGYF